MTDVGWVGVYSLRAAQSLVIVFGVCEVVTEGNIPKGRRHEAKYALSYAVVVFNFAHMPSGSHFAGYSLVYKSFSRLNL